MDDWSLSSSMDFGPVTVRVQNLAQVASFYTDVVGLSAADRSPETIRLESASTTLIELVHDPECQPRPRESAGLFHVAIRVPTRTALAAALHRVERHGSLDGASDHGVSHALYLTDPDENGVEIYYDRPRSEWPYADGNLRIPTQPLDLDALRSHGAYTPRSPADTDIGHIHLEVTDLERSVSFYRDRLGLRVRYAVAGGVFLAAGDYHHHIGLNTWNHRTAPLNGCGLQQISIVATIDESRGAQPHPAVDTVRDPDGIPIQLSVRESS